MGNFYTNCTLRGPAQHEVAAALSGRKAFVSPSQNGSIVVFDSESDTQDQEVMTDLASRLSREFSCAALSVLNHDDDILWYQLHVNGELVDEYNSFPNYFDLNLSANSIVPAGGDAKQLCLTFGAGDSAVVETILRKSPLEKGGYVFAFQRHQDLVRELNLPDFAVGLGFKYIDRGDLPGELSNGHLIRTI